MRTGSIVTTPCISGKCLFVNDIDHGKSFWLFQTLSFQLKRNDVIYLGGAVFLSDIRTKGMYFALSYLDGVKVPAYIQFQASNSNYEHFSLLYKKDVDEVIQAQIGSNTAGMATGYFDHIYAINLTDVFQSGNEPSKEWVDQHIPFFPTTANIS